MADTAAIPHRVPIFKMTFYFPDSESLEYALATGLVETARACSPVLFHRTPEGGLYVQPEQDWPASASKKLSRIAERPNASKVPNLDRRANTWLELLPLKADQTPFEPDSQTAVLFEVGSESELAKLVVEIFRLGNDRQSVCRTVNSTSEATILLKVVGPPYYTYLAAADAEPDDDSQSSRIRVYTERSPGVWVRVGWNHALANKVAVQDGFCTLIDPPDRWRQFDQTGFEEIYQHVQFHMPADSVKLEPRQPVQPIAVPLKLQRGVAGDRPELWVMSSDVALTQLDRFVSDSDYRLLQRLRFTVSRSSDGQEMVVLRAAPGRQQPPIISWEGAVAYRKHSRHLNLYLPEGMRLHPLLRLDVVRQLLANDPDQLVWLQPAENNGFTPVSIPESGFVELSKWVEYVVESNKTELQHWVQSSLFEFDQFICLDAGSAKPERPSGKPANPITRPAQPDLARPNVDKLPDQSSTDSQPSLFDQPSSVSKDAEVGTAKADAGMEAWRQRRQELEQAFNTALGPLNDPNRTALWDQLAEANEGCHDFTEAVLCWQHCFWHRSELNSRDLRRMWESAVAGVSDQRHASDIETSLAINQPSPSDVKRLAALFLLQVHSGEKIDWQRLLPRLQTYFAENDNRLSIRLAWLVQHHLARLAGNDLLGLARSRDRLLLRLMEYGVNPELETPSFLRFFGGQSEAAIRSTLGQCERLHTAVRKWVGNSLANPGPQSLTDNGLTVGYVDLIFAFAMARLGQGTLSLQLADAGAKVLHQKGLQDQVGLVSRFLFGAFQMRIRQAVDGVPLSGPLSEELMAEFQRIETESQGEDKAFDHALYAINRAREQSRIIEPDEKVDPYQHITGGYQEELSKALNLLPKVTDPVQLSKQIRKLYAQADRMPIDKVVLGKAKVLFASLPLAPRAGEELSLELLGWLARLLASCAESKKPIIDVRLEGHLFERGLYVAGHYDRSDYITSLIQLFLSSASQKSQAHVVELINVVAGESLKGLRALSLHEQIESLLRKLQQYSLGNLTLAQARQQESKRPEQWAKLLQSQLRIAGGWIDFGYPELAEPVLQMAREEIFSSPTAKPVNQIEFTRLVQVYMGVVANLGSELGFQMVIELFEKLSPQRVVNKLTTSSYYSRLHWALAESAVLALVNDQLSLSPEAQKWLDEDEAIIRNRIHRDMNQFIEKYQ